MSEWKNLPIDQMSVFEVAEWIQDQEEKLGVVYHAEFDHLLHRIFDQYDIDDDYKKECMLCFYKDRCQIRAHGRTDKFPHSDQTLMFRQELEDFGYNDDDFLYVSEALKHFDIQERKC